MRGITDEDKEGKDSHLQLQKKVCVHLSHGKQQILRLMLQQLGDIKGLSDTKIEKMLEAAKKCVTGYGWQTAASVEKQVS